MSSNPPTKLRKGYCALLEKLPDELLLQIVSYLPSGQRLTDAARTCRRLHRVVQPLFFKTISFYVNLTHPVPGRGMDKYDRLLRILQARSDIRSQVKRLGLEIRRWGPEFPPGDQKYASDLIDLMPALKSLRISAPPEIFDNDRSALDFRKSQFPSHSQKDQLEPDLLVSKEELVFWYLLRRPNLKLLVIDGDTFTNIGPPPWQSLYSSSSWTSNISDLRLYQWFDTVWLSHLHDVLRIIRALKCFHLELYCPWESSDYEAGITTGGMLSEALLPHTGTLEELFICASDAGKFFDRRNPPPGTLEMEIADYPKLKRIGIPELLVARHDDGAMKLSTSLPSNVEILQVQFQMYDSQAPDRLALPRQRGMEELLLKSSEQFPRLRRVVWWLQQYDCWAKWTYGYGKVLDDFEETYTEPRFEWLSESFMDCTPLYKLCRWDKEEI